MGRTQILLATDFSSASGLAWRRAVEMSRDGRASLFIAHVLEPPVPFSPDGYVLPRMYDEIAGVVRADAEKRMRRLLERTRKAGVPAKGLLLRGVPHEAIARAARSHRADQIVVGTHGRRGFSRLFLGSVASRVLAAAPCPVLVVPASRKARRSS